MGDTQRWPRVVNFTPFIMSLSPPEQRPETAHPVRSSFWEGVAGGRKSPEFGEVPETRPGPPTSCQHSPGFSHQARLSLSHWVLIQGCGRRCRHPARSARATPGGPAPGRAGAGHPGEGGSSGTPGPPPQERHGWALGGRTRPCAVAGPQGVPSPLLEVWPEPSGHVDSRPLGLLCWPHQGVTRSMWRSVRRPGAQVVNIHAEGSWVSAASEKV